ncbi:hypothetical protein FM106_07645 [Brachybacterium faecium]|nr:hypothetical protein FM106_07645 [Brachybacterium faecium]
MLTIKIHPPVENNFYKKQYIAVEIITVILGVSLVILLNCKKVKRIASLG